MNWYKSHRCDGEVRPLADRHYSRQTIGAKNFVPPGRCLVLKQYRDSGGCGAYWVTSWPFAEYVRHAWAGAWVCSAFRNEGSGILSSELILEAIAATRYKWPDVPEMGMITFVDAPKVNSRNPGYCFKMAGFVEVGKTKGGLIALQMLPELMPEPKPALDVQVNIFDLIEA